MEQLALTFAGFATPFLVQLIRKYLGDVALGDKVAQLIVLVVALTLAMLAGLVTGALGNAEDVLKATGMVFSVATIVYKSVLQSLLDNRMLDKSNL